MSEDFKMEGEEVLKKRKREEKVTKEDPPLKRQKTSHEESTVICNNAPPNPSPLRPKIPVNQENTPKPAKVVKRRIALFISYIGTDYNGLQYQKGSSKHAPHVKTIEGDLFKAIYKAGGMTERNYLNGEGYSKVGWNRASRTDSGVHSLCNIVSLKLLLRENIIERINANLPVNIHVHGYQRVSKKFTPHKVCGGREYEMVVPSFVFRKDPKLLALGQKCQTRSERVAFHQNIQNVKLINRLAVRLTPSELGYLNELFSCYLGTKCFKNFTDVKKLHKGKIASSYRYVTKCGIEDAPFVINGMEFVTVKIYGQSFVMHQIRKMVAFVAFVIWGHHPADLLLQARVQVQQQQDKKGEKQQFVDKKKNVGVFSSFQPVYFLKTPGTGLYLKKLHFDAYNKKKDLAHAPLDQSVYTQSMERFRNKLVTHMAEMEMERATWGKFVLAIADWVVKDMLEPDAEKAMEK